MSKNICILPILRHHTHFFVKKMKKIPNCQFCLFFDIFIKNAKIKKSDSQNPKKWLSCIIKLEILDFQVETNGKRGFCKQFLNSVKVEEKIMKINFCT